MPVAWIALEYLRGHLMSGFAWYYLGHSQHDFLPLIQVADVAGAYGVSFAVAAVNAVLFELLVLAPGFRRLIGLPDAAVRMPPRRLAWQALAVAGLLIGMLTYGAYRLGQDDFAAGPRVALIQGNLDQRIRNAVHSKLGRDDAIRFMFDHYRTLCNQAMAQQPAPDLIVWPETSYPEEWLIAAPEMPPEHVPRDLHGIDWVAETDYSWRAVVRKTAESWPTHVLLGIGARVLETDETMHRYNSALLVRPDGQVGGRYGKIHRVPFGEYVPLREALPWMKTFAPYDNDYSLTPGRQLTRFALPANGQTYHFGVAICYEDTDPYLARQFAREDDAEPLADRLHRWFFDWGRPQFPVGTGQPAVDFLVNISNDGWFDGSCEHQEHLAICRFRAVECRRTVARAVNMGISAVIDGNGRLVALPRPSWEGSKKVADVLTAAMPLDRRSSFYAAWGDWLPWTCALIIGMAVIRGRWLMPLSTKNGEPDDV
jgi:apolipoprotein N-acyltransferase